MTSWSHVLVMGLTQKPQDPKRFCFEALREVFADDSGVYLIDRDAIGKLTKPVPTNSAMLVGLTSRPDRTTIDGWTKHFGGRNPHIMLGHKVWAIATNTFTAEQVAPNQQRILLPDQTQTLYDIAVAEGYRKRTPRHHPVSLAEHYQGLGFKVKAVTAQHGMDGRQTGYDATIEMGDALTRTGLVAIGRHNRFSGLLIPEATS